jgi:D-glycero-D-manno-heptose 1,7-bisphosphate phosphatase
MSALRPALFLDRDGVINEETAYLYRREDVRWVPGIHSLLRTAAELGYAPVIVTNQSGIARGLYTEDDFHVLMRWMCAELAGEQGAAIAGVYFCPFHPRGEVAAYRRESVDRKPAPGMLLRAAEELGLDLGRSVLVGDRCSDLQAAQAAGLRQAFLLRGTEIADCDTPHRSVGSLAEVEAWLCGG